MSKDRKRKRPEPVKVEVREGPEISTVALDAWCERYVDHILASEGLTPKAVSRPPLSEAS